MSEHMAYVKGNQEDEWKPLPWGGLNYIVTQDSLSQLHQMVSQMSTYFPHNQYKIEEIKI